MRVQFRLNLRRLVLALIALLSFGAILLKQSDQYLHFRAAAAAQSVVGVNAASYQPGPLARGSLASVFGNNLASQNEKSQSNPAPTSLAGVTLQVIDSAGVTRDAGLVMVSGKQINFVIPDDAAPGEARFAIKNGADIIAQGKLQVVDSAPALFASGSGARKLAVGMTGANGVNESIVNSDGNPRMVSPGALGAPNTLTLLGTGIRYSRDVLVQIGDQKVAPTFVGPGDAPGVDQVSLRIPMTLRGGMNTLSLIVNSQSSATAPSGATTLAASAATSSATAQASNAVQAMMQGDAPASSSTLSPDDVRLIVAQAVAKAQQIGLPVTIAVLDQEGNVLAVFKMNGARFDTLIGSTDLTTGRPTKLRVNDPDGLEGFTIPIPNAPAPFNDGAALAAISKAGTAAYFSTQGSSITTRTASFIVQEFIPPGISSQPGGDLFGVQFSSLPCSDVRNPRDRNLPNLPLGLSADPGGIAIYKNGFAVGAVGIEGDGFYSLDPNVMDFDQLPEEQIAVAALRGFRPAPAFRIDRVRLNGMGVPHDNIPLAQADGPAPAPFASLPGMLIGPVDPVTQTPVVRGQQISGFTPLTLGGIPGRVAPGYFPFMDSQVSNLTAGDVTRILTQAAQQAYRMRAAIRVPTPQPTEVNIAVIDTSGKVLGLFSTIDAPQFGFDVSVQKARNALFFTLPNSVAQLRAADANISRIVPGSSAGKYADAAIAFGVPLNGSVAFTARAMGFLARPFFPDGININSVNGPFSKPINIWSPFNTGLQLTLVKPALASILSGGTPPSGDPFNCSPIPNDITVGAGLMIFAGSVPLYKGNTLVGVIGISGDGIEQDELVASAGAFGFDAPPAIRADQLIIQGARLPYVVFPRHPNIGNPAPVPPVIRTSRVFPNMN